MKHLHIMTNDKFVDNFIKFIEENFNINKHFFIIVGNSSKGKNEKSTYELDNLYRITSFKSLKNLYILEKKMYKSFKIHLHGLFYKQLIRLFFIQRWLLKKCNWIVWGGDLYSLKAKSKWEIDNYIKKKVIKHMGEITSFIPGDYKKAQKWYNTKAKYNYAITYNISANSKYIDNLIKESSRKNENKKVFLIGNSATPSNNHYKVLNRLGDFKDKNIEVIVPLSYGDEDYRRKIIKHGKSLFGNKFISLIEFYPLKKYLKILNRVDVAFFNHDRQQALGNITKLLRLGKKVYIKSSITTWDYFKNMGGYLFDIKKIYTQNYEEIIFYDNYIAKKNIKLIKKIRSKAYRVKLWENILKK